MIGKPGIGHRMVIKMLIKLTLKPLFARRRQLTERVFPLLAVLTLAIFIFPTSLSAQSLSESELNSIYSDTVWYKPDSCSVELDLKLTGNDRIEQAFNFFIQKGLSAEQAAGIVGNFRWESGVDPTKTNSSSGAHGIAQWLGGRLDGLRAYAAQLNQDADSLALQLKYSWYEFTHSEGAALKDLKTQTTVEGSALSVFNKYERAGDSTGPDRVQFAQDIYNQYKNSSGAVVSAPAGSSSCSSVGTGQNTKYIDGFTIYSQYDPAWASKPYGASTIAESGCGPTAMAMIITNLTGKNITPDITAAYASSQGLYVPGVGSSWSIAPVLARHWELKASPIGASIAKISATLKSGGLVIASGQGPLPFTSGGHYIVIRGVTADGKWMIGDPGHNDTSDKEWDPQQLVASMNDGSVYAITK